MLKKRENKNKGTNKLTDYAMEACSKKMQSLRCWSLSSCSQQPCLSCLKSLSTCQFCGPCICCTTQCIWPLLPLVDGCIPLESIYNATILYTPNSHIHIHYPSCCKAPTAYNSYSVQTGQHERCKCECCPVCVL